MTNAERLAHPCPKCHAKAGDWCIDPIGDRTPGLHKVRGPGQYDQHLQERIDRQAARQKAEYGPLFADLAEAEVYVPTVTEVKAQERRAFTLAPDADGPAGMLLQAQANKGMECIYLGYLGRELERLAGEQGRLFAEKVMRTYPLDYGRMIFCEFMTTTRRQELNPYRVPADNSIGFTIAYRHVWEPAAPLMTRAEFDARYPKPDHWRGDVDAEEPDDGGLFERTVGALLRI